MSTNVLLAFTTLMLNYIEVMNVNAILSDVYLVYNIFQSRVLHIKLNN